MAAEKMVTRAIIATKVSGVIARINDDFEVVKENFEVTLDGEFSVAKATAEIAKRNPGAKVRVDSIEPIKKIWGIPYSLFLKYGQEVERPQSQMPAGWD